MKHYLFKTPLIILFLLLPCPDPALGKGRKEMLVSTSWLARQGAGSGLVILHVAPDRSTYDRGHIPGARYVPLGEIIISRDGLPNEMPPVSALQQLFTKLGIGNRDRIVIYGEPSVLSATRTLFTLAYLGHGGRGALLDGGLAKWRAEGYPVEQATPSFSPSTFTPRLNPGLIVGLEAMRNLSWVAANLAPPNVSIVDSRSPEVYAGSAEKKTGHIPGAINRFWMDDLEKEGGALRSRAELDQAYAAIGLNRDRMTVSYCNTGMQSSHTWFVLQYLGIDSLLYDGSMAEWSRATNAPIVSGNSPK